MASNYPQEKTIFDPGTFDSTEISIRKSFNSMTQKLMDRRDQLIEQLCEIRENYLYEEEKRTENLKYLDKMIMEKQNENIERYSKINEKMIIDWKAQQEQYSHPNPIPSPHFDTYHLEELLNQMEKFGALEDPTSKGKKGKGHVELDHPYAVVWDRKENVSMWI